MEIRPLRGDDIDRLVDQLWLPFSREMADLDPYNELATDVREYAIAYRQEQLEDADVATFLAVADETLLGYTVVTYSQSPPVFTRGPSGNVAEVYVARDHRGEGVATALMDRAEAWARDRGCEYVTLSVNEGNEAAQDLYESRGYGVRRYKMDKRLE